MHQINFDDLNLNMNITRYTRENLTTPVRLQKYIPNNYGLKKEKRIRTRKKSWRTMYWNLFIATINGWRRYSVKLNFIKSALEVKGRSPLRKQNS
eukprot:TRINITY_DN3319_c3_g2_i1.p2 TRINITY_DN3319_c3_g2~~TRINITY_DN3319_c3_g2_i1.p2  ORF type:complete len:95 (+),score=5.09 TRINITY_DN3319_c3_g2_i1:713-997(+)